jgi:isopenicillin N synthase-like dioxygenase
MAHGPSNISAESMTASSIPEIDLGPFISGADKLAVARAVGGACEEIGFCTITGHGVPAAVTQNLYTSARAFFDLPDDQKRQLKMQANGAGYSPLQGETLAASLGQSAPADLKESLNIGAEMNANVWPPQPPALRRAAVDYFNALVELSATLMRVFALALELPEDFFADKINRHRSFLRIINYPDQPEAPQPGQLRAGAHTDYGTLTILKTEDAPGGLQVRNREGEWMDVPALPDSFVVNLGDLMQYWTNDKWASTLHRVVNPPRDRALGSRRQSIAFFHNPNPDALVAPLATCIAPGETAKYPPITAGEHLAQKTGKAYQKT